MNVENPRFTPGQEVLKSVNGKLFEGLVLGTHRLRNGAIVVLVEGDKELFLSDEGSLRIHKRQLTTGSSKG